MIVQINERKYWDVVNNISDIKPMEEWFNKSEREINEEWLGLEFVCENPKNIMTFSIVDKTKYAWAKVMYSI